MQTFWNELNKQNFQKHHVREKPLDLGQTFGEGSGMYWDLVYKAQTNHAMTDGHNIDTDMKHLNNFFLWTSTNTTKLLFDLCFIFVLLHSFCINKWFQNQIPNRARPFPSPERVVIISTNLKLPWNSKLHQLKLNQQSYQTIRWVNSFFLSLCVYLIFCDCIFNICFCNRW